MYDLFIYVHGTPLHTIVYMNSIFQDPAVESGAPPLPPDGPSEVPTAAVTVSSSVASQLDLEVRKCLQH